MNTAEQRGADNLVKVGVGRVLTQLVLFISAFAIPRAFGVTDYGLYAAVMAVLSMVQPVSSFGLLMVEARTLAPLWQSRNVTEAVTLASTIAASRVGLSLLASILVMLWLTFDRLVPSVALCLALGLVALLRFSFDSARSLLLALGRAGQFAGFDFFRSAGTLVVALLAYPAVGLRGVFLAFPFLYFALLVFAAVALWRLLPLRFGQISWPALRPHLRYSTFAFIGTLAEMVQFYFAVYAVASLASHEEAGHFAFALQLFVMVQGFYLAGRTSLMPVMAEFEAKGQSERLREWGDVILRYGVALGCLATVGWALVGQQVIRFTLTESFSAAYPAGTIMLLSVMFYCAGATCCALLYLRGLAGAASAILLAYAALTAAGVLGVLRMGNSSVAENVAWVHAATSLLYFVFSYLALRVTESPSFDLRPSALLIAPVALAWPAVSWNASSSFRWLALLVFLLGYGAWILLFRLLPWRRAPDARA